MTNLFNVLRENNHLVRGVNRLSVFGLGGGGVSLRAAGNHWIVWVIIRKQILSSIVGASSARPPTAFFFDFYSPGPVFILARVFYVFLFLRLEALIPG